MYDDLVLDFGSNAATSADWRVRRVRGREAISEPYRFEIELSAPIDSFDLEALLHSSARLSLGRADVRRDFHGILTECHEVDVDSNGHALLRLVLMPRLQLLDLSRRLEARRDLSSIELALGRMETCALEVETRLEGRYPRREFVVQYRESDLAFASRLLEHEGVSYFFEPGDRGERLVLTDHNEGFARGAVEPIGFRGDDPGRDSVASLACRRERAPQRLVLGDYNDRTPHVPLWAEAEVEPAGTGLVADYGDHFETPEEGAALARIRAEELACRSERYRGSVSADAASVGARFRAGHRYLQADHPRAEWNREYLVVEVVHEASAAGFGEPAGWRLEFEALPMARPYRPALRTPKPRLQGSLPAHIGGTIDESGLPGKADRDADGRYKLILPFDHAGWGGSGSSPYVRMEKPGQGVDFALPSGTEVLWTGLDGDPDRPVITGAVHNAFEQGVVSNAGLLRSHGGASIEFNDGERAPATAGGWTSGPMGSPAAWQEAAAGQLAAQRPLQPPDAISDSGTTGASHKGTAADESTSFLRMYVPHTDVAAGEEPSPSAAATYLRMGRRPPDSSFEWDLFNKFQADYTTSDDRDSLQAVYGAEGTSGANAGVHTHGIFDYTDGDRIVYTGGDKREIIGGTSTTWIKDGTATVYDAEPTYAVTFGEVGDLGHWRKTERKYVSEDTYAWGDTEDMFFGYKFDLTLGFNTGIFIGGSLSGAAAVTADLVLTGGCTWGGAWQYDRTKGGNVSVRRDETIKVHDFLTLRSEENKDLGKITGGDTAALVVMGLLGVGATAALGAKGHAVSGWQGSVYPAVTFGAYAALVFGSYKSFAKHKSTAKDGDFGSQIDLGLERLRIAQGDGKEGTVSINLYGDTIHIKSKKVIALAAKDINITGNLNVAGGEIKCWKGVSSVGPDNMSNLTGPPPFPPSPAARPRIRKTALPAGPQG